MSRKRSGRARQAIMDFEKEIIETFQRHPEVIAVYLFGSYASGRQLEGSDLDVAVLLATPVKGKELHDLEMTYFRELSERIPKNLDIVILNRAGEILTHEILTKGKLVYERDRDKRVEFEARRIVDYLDFLPYFERMQKGMMQRLRQRVRDGRS